jgi:hypothetical protein
MLSLVNQVFRSYLGRYQEELEQHYSRPNELQRLQLEYILQTNRNTAFGRQYGLTEKMGAAAYAERVPVHHYDDIAPWLERQLAGEAGAVCAHPFKWIATTSGTSTGKSKLVPLTHEAIRESHSRGGWFALATLYKHYPEIQIFSRKNMLIGGSYKGLHPEYGLPSGDISAVLIQNIPLLVRPFYTPDIKTATLPDYEKKLELIAQTVAYEDSLTMLGGVPTWNLPLYRRILEIRGVDSILEVWPNLQAFIHGGVSFEPYRAHFEKIIPRDDFIYLEVYNATEGFFGVRDHDKRDDMLLLLSNQIYYEFIPFPAYREQDYGAAVPLSEVNTTDQYVMLITTNSGLYRFVMGDLIRFTTLAPYRIKIEGRTQEFINAFGEDLLNSEVERALLAACNEQEARVSNYSIAPAYMELNKKGQHQWFVEFEVLPADVDRFRQTVDQTLQKINYNYGAKRMNDLAVKELELIVLPAGAFQDWMRRRGKLGGQHKVPKLANHRRYAEELLRFLDR